MNRRRKRRENARSEAVTSHKNLFLLTLYSSGQFWPLTFRCFARIFKLILFLWFSDTQASIKADNPTASFGSISKIVATMWDALSDSRKLVKEFLTKNEKNKLKFLELFIQFVFFRFINKKLKQQNVIIWSY